jgi:hypothetical protein
MSKASLVLHPSQRKRSLILLSDYYLSNCAQLAQAFKMSVEYACIDFLAPKIQYTLKWAPDSMELAKHFTLAKLGPTSRLHQKDMSSADQCAQLAEEMFASLQKKLCKTPTATATDSVSSLACHAIQPSQE